MNQYQANRAAMYDTVTAYLTKNRGIWSGLKAFADAVGELQASAEAIDAHVSRQQAPNGATDEKAAAWEALEESLIELADTLAAFAAKTANPDLTARVELTRSGIAKLSDDNLVKTSRRIEAAAAENLAALADYSVTPGRITELGTLRDAFSALKAAPRTAIASRVGAPATLPDLFDAANRILRDRLDRLVTRFRKTEAEFVAG